MSRTITAMFENRQKAEAAAETLRNARLDAERIQILDQGSPGYRAEGYSDSEDRGFWASVKDIFLPDDDRYAYEEGVRRGGVVVSAQVDETEADEAIRILDESDSIDLDRRQEEWRDAGWTHGVAAGGQSLNDRREDSDRSGSGIISEERLPIVEEALRVGKREVARGGARVRSYVIEQPVDEDVTLREEHVSVERRPTNERMSEAATADVFREREIEMTETAEEAVVAKEAVVREEVVVRKTAEERTENIKDTVRRTEVEVDEGVDGRDIANQTERANQTDRDRKY